METEGATEAARWKTSGGVLSALGYANAASPVKPAAPPTIPAVAAPAEPSVAPKTSQPASPAASRVTTTPEPAKASPSQTKTTSVWGDAEEEEEDDWDSKPIAKPTPKSVPRPNESAPSPSPSPAHRSAEPADEEDAWGNDFDEPAPKAVSPAQPSTHSLSFTSFHSLTLAQRRSRHWPHST